MRRLNEKNTVGNQESYKKLLISIVSRKAQGGRDGVALFVALMLPNTGELICKVLHWNHRNRARQDMKYNQFGTNPVLPA